MPRPLEQAGEFVLRQTSVSESSPSVILQPPPVPIPVDRDNRTVLLSCGAALVLFLAPFIVAVAARYESFAMANESLAYRWGHPSRTSIGDVPPIMLQGFTLTAAHQYLVIALESVYPPSTASLRTTLQLFTWITFLLFFVAFAGILFSAARKPSFGAGEIAWISVPWTASILATGGSGWYYCLLPDYYHLNAILACAVVLLGIPFARRLSAMGTFPVRPMDTAALGFVLGLGVANKITWGAPCLVVFGLVLLGIRSTLKQVALHGALIAGSAVLSCVLVLLAYYRFDVTALAPALREWIAFMRGQEGSMELGGAVFFNRVKSSNYDVLYPLQGITIIVAGGFARSWRERAGVAFCLAGIIALWLVVVMRPAGTTLWDINVLTLTLTALAVSILASRRILNGIMIVWLLVFVGLNVRNPPTTTLEFIRASSELSADRFLAFDEINRFAGTRPQVVILVNNDYHHEGVYELLLKAAADSPTWNITSGRTWLRNFGDITYYHEYGPPIELPADLANSCVVWFDRPDFPQLTTRYERLEQLAHDPAYEIISLPIYGTSLAQTPPILVWMHAARLREAQPFHSIFEQSSVPPLMRATRPPANTGTPRK